MNTRTQAQNDAEEQCVVTQAPAEGFGEIVAVGGNECNGQMSVKGLGVSPYASQDGLEIWRVWRQMRSRGWKGHTLSGGFASFGFRPATLDPLQPSATVLNRGNHSNIHTLT